MPSPTQLLTLGLLAVASVPTAYSADCTLALTATSATQWRVGCADDITQTAQAPTTVTFDPSKLTAVKVGSYSAVQLQPLNAAQPTELRLPARRIKIDSLVSTSLAAVSIEGDATAASKATLEIGESAFAGMTAMKTLSVNSVNVTTSNSIRLTSTVSTVSMTRCGLTEFKVTSASSSSALNITKVDLRYNRLRQIPLAVLTNPSLVECNLQENTLTSLRLSRRKVRRVVRLVTTKRLTVSSIGNFTEQCDGGEKTNVRIGQTTVAVCQLPSEPDDNLVVEEAGSDGSLAESSEVSSNSTTSGTTTTGGSTSTTTNSSTTTTTGGTTTNSTKVTTTIISNSSTTIVTTSKPTNSTKNGKSTAAGMAKLPLAITAVAVVFAFAM